MKDNKKSPQVLILLGLQSKERIMPDIFMREGSFAAIMLLGNLLKRIGFFHTDS